MSKKKSFFKSLFLVLIIIILLVFAWYVNGGSFYLDRESKDIQITQGVKHAVPLEDIIDRGAAKDDIPSIDKPKFESVTKADQSLSDEELVIGLIKEGKEKAYPLQILRWHEIVNDKIGKTPIAITFSPLTGTTKVFQRKIKKQSIFFGVSGKLYNNNTLIYDRATQSLWAQLSGSAVVGEMTGVVLDEISSFVFTWAKWKELYPDSEILSRDTGYFLSYNINPYYDYDESDSVYFPVSYEDKRIFAKKVIFGIGDSGQYKAYSEEKIANDKIINDEVGDKKFILLWDETASIVRAYDRVLEDGREITLEKRDKYYDNEGLEWSLEGKGVSENNSDLSLSSITPTRTFWFSWVAFYPDTEIYI